MLIYTGIAIEVPPGYEAQVRPRSSLSRYGILCALGTIDSDYRGQIGVTLSNLTGADLLVNAGDRIAQLVIARVELPEWHLVDATELTATERGAGGFGSTGR